MKIFREELFPVDNFVGKVSMQPNIWSTESGIYHRAEDDHIMTSCRRIKHEAEERFKIPYGGYQFMPILDSMMMQDDISRDLKQIAGQQFFNISVDAISTQQNNSSPESGVNQAEDENYNDHEETSDNTIEEIFNSEQITPIFDNTMALLEPFHAFPDVFTNKVVVENQEYDSIDNIDNITASIDDKIIGLDPWIGGCDDSGVSPPKQNDVISDEDDLHLHLSDSEIDSEDDTQPPSCDQELATGTLFVKNTSVTQVTTYDFSLYDC